MMAELLYKIADIINANSKVYRAVVPEARHDYMMHENGRLVKSSCLVLRIMLSGKVKYHISRTVWNIYENDIAKIIKKFAEETVPLQNALQNVTPHYTMLN